jgi:hypothetical protein
LGGSRWTSSPTFFHLCKPIALFLLAQGTWAFVKSYSITAAAATTTTTTIIITQAHAD